MQEKLEKNLTICLAKTMISLPLSSHFETSMSNLRFSTLNTSTCSRILALSCSGIFFIASRAVVMPDTSGYSSTSGPGSIKIRKIKIKSALVYFSTGLFKTEEKIIMKSVLVCSTKTGLASTYLFCFNY